MSKRIASILAAAAFILAFAMQVPAIAEGTFTGKVTNISGERIILLVDGEVPAWARPGVLVKAGGGVPRVLRVQGNEMTLKFGKEKASKIQVDQVLTVTETSGDIQGC